MTERKPWPASWCLPVSTNTQVQILRRIEAELAQHARAQKIIDDIKRRCGVSTEEK